MMRKGWKTGLYRCAALAGMVAMMSGCISSAAAGTGVEALTPEAVSYEPGDSQEWSTLMKENQISDSFKEALGRFAYRTGSQVLSEGEGNVNFSPLSLYYAAAMAGSGAEGETAAQMMDSLGAEDRDQLSEQCRKLYQWFYYEGQRRKGLYEQYGGGTYDSAVQLGNSLWISHQLKLKQDYRQLAAARFFASSYQVDFARPETGEQIGGWIADQTRGVLQPEIKTDPGTMMTILNTLYFYGGWENTFPAAGTAEDRFTPENGSSVTCPFMNQVETGSFYKEDGYTVSALSTDNGCRMVFLLPDQGHSVEEFLSSPEQLEAALGAGQEKWQSGEVTWKVPKFAFGSSLELAPLLKQMGMENMFLPTAQFGGISDDPLFVTDVIQETHIGIDENGVEGAAYTMLAVAAGIPMVEEKPKADMILDRPFIYGIQDDVTGVWLFLGVCRNPAEGQNR